MREQGKRALKELRLDQHILLYFFQLLLLGLFKHLNLMLVAHVEVAFLAQIIVRAAQAVKSPALDGKSLALVAKVSSWQGQFLGTAELPILFFEKFS